MTFALDMENGDSNPYCKSSQIWVSCFPGTDPLQAALGFKLSLNRNFFFNSFFPHWKKKKKRKQSQETTKPEQDHDGLGAAASPSAFPGPPAHHQLLSAYRHVFLTFPSPLRKALSSISHSFALVSTSGNTETLTAEWCPARGVSRRESLQSIAAVCLERNPPRAPGWAEDDDAQKCQLVQCPPAIRKSCLWARISFSFTSRDDLHDSSVSIQVLGLSDGSLVLVDTMIFL